MTDTQQAACGSSSSPQQTGGEGVPASGVGLRRLGVVPLPFRLRAGLQGAQHVLQRPLLLVQGVLLQRELALLGPDQVLHVSA